MKWEKSSRGVGAKVRECNLEVTVFELRTHYYVHFWTNTPGKDMKTLKTPVMG